MALHWYEWQQGDNGTSPGRRFRFDTHYPDYFPPREGFAEAVHTLQVKTSRLNPKP